MTRQFTSGRENLNKVQIKVLDNYRQLEANFEEPRDYTIYLERIAAICRPLFRDEMWQQIDTLALDFPRSEPMD